MLVKLHRLLQAGQPAPQVGLVRHLGLVLHDLISGFCHDVLDLESRAENATERRLIDYEHQRSLALAFIAIAASQRVPAAEELLLFAVADDGSAVKGLKCCPIVMHWCKSGHFSS